MNPYENLYQALEKEAFMGPRMGALRSGILKAKMKLKALPATIREMNRQPDYSGTGKNAPISENEIKNFEASRKTYYERDPKKRIMANYNLRPLTKK